MLWCRLADHVHVLTVYVAGRSGALSGTDHQALVESFLSEAHMQTPAADAEEDGKECQSEEGAG